MITVNTTESCYNKIMRKTTFCGCINKEQNNKTVSFQEPPLIVEEKNENMADA